MEKSTAPYTRLTDIQRAEIGEFILLNQVHGKIIRSCRKEAAQRWNTSVRTVSRLHALQISQDEQGLAQDLTSKMKGKKGRKSIHINKELAMAVQLHRRTTQRDYAAALEVSITKMHKWIKEGKICSHSNAIKPQISCINEMNRLFYSVSHLKHDIVDGKTNFLDMHHVVHIDEKWFFITRVAERYYLLLEEEEPHRTVQNKRYIQKNNVLICGTQTCFNSEREVLFDGKIGIWPFITKEPAKDTSINRTTGTIVTKPIPSIDGEVIKKFMLTKLVPAIKRKWPLLSSTNITIRQDNARPHICDDDPEFRRVASADGFNIRLGFQPPDIPDLNILDLRFFRSIQSLQHKKNSRTLDELVEATINAFTQLHPKTLNRVFLSLQCVMVEIMKCKGSNRYKLPHMGKDALERQGLLPTNLEVDTELVRECLQYLMAYNYANGLQHLIDQVMG